MDNSTFVGNVGGSDGGLGTYGGGGIYNYQGEMTIRNSTFSGNSAPESEGGAIVTWGTLTLLNSTLIGNSSGSDSGASGLANWETLHMKNTLIASDSPYPDCGNRGTIVTNINNLVEDGSCNATFSGDPLLGPLADNGGPRVGAAQDIPLQTHALLLGSPALDAGDGGTCLASDQRGAPRPQGAACDIGALEMFRLVVSKSVTPTVNVPYHGLVTYTLTLSNTSPVSDTTVLLTDTLPDAVDFGAWVANHGATVSLDDTLTWSGVVTAGAQMAFTFTAEHTGDYNETVVNTATFSSGAQWWASGADTATFTTECLPARSVQNGHDSGPGSLRAAIAEVCSGGLITFSNDVSIILGSELLLDKSLTIDGHGRAVTLSGNDTVRVFNIASGSAVTLSHLSIVSGTATDGGGIYNAGNLIVQAGTLLLQNSTLSGNTAPYGGGINSTGNATLQNSTLSGNTGDAGAGGGIRQWGGALRLYNTILANSGAGGDCFVNASDVILANVHNLVEDGSCSSTNGVGFLSGDPLLGPLADNGGGTQTHALLATSPAIVAGDPATCLASDQRGELRADLRGDIGAYEVQYADSDTVSKTFSDTVTHSFGPTWVSMTLAVADTGSVTVTKHITTPGGLWEAGEITVTWWITHNLSAGLPVTVSFCYTDTEIGAVQEWGLTPFRWNDSDWEEFTGSYVVDTANHCVTAQSVSNFSPWTLFDTSGTSDKPTAARVVALAAWGFAPVAAGLLLVLGAFYLIHKGQAPTQTPQARPTPAHSAPRPDAYTPPALVHEGALEIQAGSPLSIPSDFEDFDELDW
mgnify:CR=1 FL=1